MSENPDALPCTLEQAIYAIQDNLRDRFGDANVVRSADRFPGKSGYITICLPGSEKGFEIAIHEVWLTLEERRATHVVGDHEDFTPRIIRSTEETS